MNAPYPIDLTLNYLTKAQPLITPEWTAWKAAMRAPKLAGTWAVSGYQPGRGKVFGTLTIYATAAEDEFTTKLELHYPAHDAKITRTGKGFVYTGYSWRGRETAEGKAAANADPGTDPAEWREAMMVSRDGNSMDGRWFWGGYDEFGIDVKMTRVAAQPVVLGTDLFSLQSSTTNQVRIFGANLPANLKPGDVDFGAGIAVRKVIEATAAVATVEVEVAKGLPVGVHDVAIGRSTAVEALTVYDKVAYIKVMPDAGMARLGGNIAAKQFMQFEAVAFAASPDGKPENDVALGPVPARWSLEEQYSTPDDDDIKFVGAVNDFGLFTPSFEGPNPARKKQTNNYPTNNWGDVWVTAAYKAEAENRRYLYLTMRASVRETDYYRMEPAQFVVLDLQEKRIAKAFPFPKDIDQGFGFGATYQVSPDGKLLYVFQEDVLVFDLATFKQIDRIELSKPEFPGAAPFHLNPAEDPYNTGNVITSAFASVDPIVHKGTIGLASLDLTTHKAEFKPIGPALPMMGFRVSPDHKRGFSVIYGGVGGNRTTEWWVWDLESHKVIKKQAFDSRPTFKFGMSGDGKKLYLYGAGSTLEIFDAETLQSHKLIYLNKDTTTNLISRARK